jgi:regulator of sigma E protease
MYVVYILLAILSLGFLIVVHEAGHYVVARWCGMRVERFSIGFGPGLFKRRAKNPETGERDGTIFQLAPIPFGGFVEIRGMNIAEDVDPDDRLAYPNRPAWQRFATIFAGPATNYVSAVILALGLYTCHGVDSSWHWYGVAAVRDGYDAAGKLAVGDRIIAVDGAPILARGDYQPANAPPLHSDSLVERVNAKNGRPVTLTVIRGDAPVEVTITPKKATDEKTGKELLQNGKPVYLLGIVPSEQADILDVGLVGAVAAAAEYPVEQTKRIGGMFYEIFTGKEKADPGGPLRIADEFAKAWKLGIVTGIQLLMMLSVYLGMFNLFPLPALDGGRLVFLGYEMVTRRRANPRIEAMVHMAGIMVLGVVMVLVTLHDFHLF